jgi:hypothetical protein
LDKGQQKSIRLSSVNKYEILAPSKHRLKIPREGVQLFEKKMANFTSEINYWTEGYEWHRVENAVVVIGICNVLFKTGSAVKQRNVSAISSRTYGRWMLWGKKA